MKYFFSVVTICSAALISGCLGPSVPEAKDVEQGLVEIWSACKMVRPVNFKKTNGYENGRTYRMSIEYKLEFVSDIAKEDLWGMGERAEKFWKTNCPEPIGLIFIRFMEYSGENGLQGRDVRAGEGFVVKVDFNMVHSEKGWVGV